MRIPRTAIASQVSWTNPGLTALGKGARSFCNWDEDSITMAVQAARNTPCALDQVERLVLASTTLPFADRSNAGIIAEAILPSNAQGACVSTADLTGSQRAATSALMQACSSSETALICAADRRNTQPASVQEMTYGHGAAAVVTGDSNLIAAYLGGASISADLVDHYRSSDATFDYALESRWIRDEGYLKLIPRAFELALSKCGLTTQDIAQAVLAIPDSAAKAVCRKLDLAYSPDPLQSNCGETGTPHVLLRLFDALATARAGDIIALIGFGQGADALIFRVLQPPAINPIDTQLAADKTESSYVKFLSFGGRVSIDWGMRAERDNRTAASTFYRKRQAVTGFLGGICAACETPQFPRSKVCVQCSAVDSQTDYGFADRVGKVKSYTEDWLGYSPGPPLTYGNVAFEGGGNVYMEFTDVSPGELSVGAPLRMVFRIKDFDPIRQFRRYFWKPTLAR